MIQIPTPLQKRGMRFILVNPKSKVPLEEGWQKDQNYEYDDPKLIQHITRGGNYGVVCGINGLIVIDADSEELRKRVEEKLEPTLTIKTGSGGRHYYFTSDLKKKIVVKEHGVHLGEIQSTRTQVIAPGSIHPNGNTYEIISTTPATLPFLSIKDIEEKLSISQDKDKEKNTKEESDKDLEIIKQSVNIRDVMRWLGFNMTKNPTECLWHDSENKMNFSYNDTVWHCFHCEKKGNIFHLVMNHNGCSFLQAKKEIIKRFNLQDKLPEYQKKIEEKKEKALHVAGLFLDKLLLAQEFIKVQPLFYDNSQLWWLWNFDKKKWELTDEIDILNFISKTHNANTIESKERNEIIQALKQAGRMNKPKLQNTNWVQFKDLIVDVSTGEEFVATPQHFVTNPIPWSLGESDETPTIDRILIEWVGMDHIKTLHQILAYCLLPNYPIHRLFCFVGGGMNGKSKFLDLLIQFIGKENVCSTDLDTLLDSRFEQAKLYKKLVCVMGETNFSLISKTSRIKQLTGQDLVSFEFKNKQPFDDINYAKIIIATNNLPSTSDKSLGYYRRWCILDFPNTFTEKKNILEDIPEQEYHNLAMKCVSLLRELLIVREFYKEGSIEERQQKYEERSNPIQKFWDEKIEENVEGSIYKFEFRNLFLDWCKNHNFRIMSDMAIAGFMKEKGILTQQIAAPWTENENNKKYYWSWVGCTWKTSKKI